MADGYTETPCNMAEIIPYVIMERETIVNEILIRQKCYFYDACSFRWHANLKKNDAAYILKYIKEDAYVITLEIGGKQLASEELADKIEQLGIQGKSQIVFIIGGSIGLGKEVLKKSNYALSFSKMTFPHQLMRVILLEQISRSYRIINREPYHK